MFKIFAMCINSIQLYVDASKKAGKVKNVVMSEMKYAFMILQQKIKKKLFWIWLAKKLENFLLFWNTDVIYNFFVTDLYLRWIRREYHFNWNNNENEKWAIRSNYINPSMEIILLCPILFSIWHVEQFRTKHGIMDPDLWHV